MQRGLIYCAVEEAGRAGDIVEIDYMGTAWVVYRYRSESLAEHEKLNNTLYNYLYNYW